MKASSIFVSHAVADAAMANRLQQVLVRLFARGVHVFVSSTPGDISPGTDWLQQIYEQIAACRAVIVLITPNSISRPWVWFELGAAWYRMKTSDLKIFPLVARQIRLSELPAPLSHLQAIGLGNPDQTRQFFESLTAVFGFGDMETVDVLKLIEEMTLLYDAERAPQAVSINQVDSSPFSGYSDEELIEIIDEEFFLPASRSFIGVDEPASESFYVFGGKLISFDEFDRDLHLPRGTASRLLRGAAARYGLTPAFEGANTIRFRSETSEAASARVIDGADDLPDSPF